MMSKLSFCFVPWDIYRELTSFFFLKFYFENKNEFLKQNWITKYNNVILIKINEKKYKAKKTREDIKKRRLLKESS